MSQPAMATPVSRCQESLAKAAEILLTMPSCFSMPVVLSELNLARKKGGTPSTASPIMLISPT
ncbi:hypothetical protein B0I35DRAFT_419292 [Stachybotrys elegans]|uniref:Uncharacterized protein n=1 Tax=Stachybotrys elegans TaxID=80388 RepID=A0A8K0T8F7_9HYPO|nr:hypothetical protein B0I35DRAFT_419292 [Stachybotrys elegans]